LEAKPGKSATFGSIITVSSKASMGSLLGNIECLPTLDVTPEVALNPDHESGIKETKSVGNSIVTYRNSDVNAARAEENTGHKCRTDTEIFYIQRTVHRDIFL